MTDDETRIFRLALLSLEETMNGVISDYCEAHNVRDGGEKLIGLVATAIQDRYEQLVSGEGDALLAQWRHKSTVN